MLSFSLNYSNMYVYIPFRAVNCAWSIPADNPSLPLRCTSVKMGYCRRFCQMIYPESEAIGPMIVSKKSCCFIPFNSSLYILSCLFVCLFLCFKHSLVIIILSYFSSNIFKKYSRHTNFIITIRRNICIHTY